MNINHIIVPTDFSATANNAVKQAFILATMLQAQVTVIHARVMYEDDPSLIPEKLRSLKKDEEEYEKELRQRLKENVSDVNIPVNYELIRGYSAPSAILNYLNTTSADLVVIGTHGRSGVEHFLIGSVTEKVVRYAPCPVLTVPTNFQGKDLFPKIVVPFDFSRHSIKALELASEFIQLGTKEIHLFYAVDKDVHPALYAWGMKSVLDIIPDIVDKAEEKMAKIMKGIPELSKAQIIKKVDTGVPHKEIARYVSKIDADLIVIATHGLVGLDRMLLGSTTERLLRAVKKPILTIKPNND